MLCSHAVWCEVASPTDSRQSVSFTSVSLADEFWSPRLTRARAVTVPFLFQKCKETGAIDNFARAAGRMDGEYQGLKMADEVVYKTVEAASYLLAAAGDPALERQTDEVIALIAAAQEPDGYLMTQRTLAFKRGLNAPARWSNMKDNELYYAGHLYEAAVAHYRATGKRTLLDVAVRNADLVCSLFGPDKRRDVCGHPNIEQALVRLSEATGNLRYRELAHFFVEERGRANRRVLQGPFSQDHVPLVAQSEAVGQAPRATYFYCGATDIAARTGHRAYVATLDRIWNNVVTKKLYLTGGIGSSAKNEGFTENYDLPNRTAYAEICAAVSFSMWNRRMFLLHGDARYLDVLERTLYNSFLAGASVSGDRFFYACPLESDGRFRFNRGWMPANYDGPFREAAATRKEWFPCACCPPNWARWLLQVPGLMYTLQGDSISINLYAKGTASFVFQGQTVTIEQDGRYPWDGMIKIVLRTQRPTTFALDLRIPGWAMGRPVPGDLYRYLEETSAPVTLRVNGVQTAVQADAGFARLRREWKAGDEVEFNLPMPVRRVVSHPAVAENVGKVALERGPIVYCLDGCDHDGRVLDLELADSARLEAEFDPHCFGGAVVIRGAAQRRGTPVPIRAILSYPGSNRGAGEMVVWMKRPAHPM
ncbi:MAG: glycoside hydrolase family 127 protein [Candidatus Sumerlaeia bacterium]|nr:glycoside hydrolase family 127 protein [Candidatus Sumerlaeia bacterium]